MIPVEVRTQLEPEHTALLLIDMQRRHLDTEVGYHTLPPERARTVVENGAEAVRAARAAGMRIVHVGTWSRHPSPWGQVDGGNPFMRWQTGKPIPGATFVRQSGKCVEGSIWAEFMPGLEPANDEPLIKKLRYSGFYATDLERVLRTLGVKNLFIAGVNTNNCVLGTSFDAHARDFRVILVEEACGSMNGQEYHEAGLRQAEAALGWIASLSEFLEFTSSVRAEASTEASTPA
jgi:nicotinamidase-related amidase